MVDARPTSRPMLATHALARHFGGASEAEQASMTAVDRLGFHVRLSNADRVWGARIGFKRPVSDREQARSALVKMVRQARQDA